MTNKRLARAALVMAALFVAVPVVDAFVSQGENASWHGLSSSSTTGEGAVGDKAEYTEDAEALALTNTEHAPLLARLEALIDAEAVATKETGSSGTALYGGEGGEAWSGFSGEDFFDLLAQTWGFGTTLPTSFAEELFNASDFEAVLVSEDEDLVCLVGTGGASELYERLCNELVAKGWIHTESGVAELGTFAKEGGEYEWIVLSCSGSEGYATAVVQLQ